MTSLAERWFGSLTRLARRKKSQREELGLMLHAFRRDWLAMISLAIVLIFILGAIFAPYLTPYPEQGRGEPNIAEKLSPPSRAHPLGTDRMGRDLLARILFGGRTSLSIGFLVVAVAILIGMPLGAIAGYYGGWVDEVIMRLTDVFLSFPPLLLALAIAAALGPSFTNAMIAIALVWWPWYTRIVRSQTLSVKERAFIEAAQGTGVGNLVIIARHVLPNVTTPVLVEATIDIGAAILTGAVMSFLGMGVQPPTPDWGKIVEVGRAYMLIAPWYATFPGLSIFLVALAMNLMGDGIRDVLDPRTRRLGSYRRPTHRPRRVEPTHPGAEPTSKVLLSVEDLYVHFHTYAGLVHAVNGVSFEILEGEVFGLVGETGCGKSVTGLSLLRLIPSPGEAKAKHISLGGDDLLAMSKGEMRRVRGGRIATIFQDPSASLNPVFSIGEQVTSIIRHHAGVDRGRAEALAKESLATVGLPSPEEILKMYPHELSGGMQQRVMIAMALSSGAELLIADEPSTALDVTIQAQILALLVKLRETRGLSILLITHNLGVVAETCDRVGVLYAGSLVEMGSTVNVLHDMKHPYTQALLAAVPRAESRGEPLVDIPGSVPSGLDPVPGCAFYRRCPHVMDVCRSERPSLSPVDEGHAVACFLHSNSAG